MNDIRAHTFAGLEYRSLSQVLEEAAAVDPHRTLTIFPQGHTTYGSLADQARSVAGRLSDYGVRTGEAVCMLMTNSPEAQAVMFGVMRARAIFSPINFSYKGEFLRHQLALSEASVVFVDAALLPEVERVAPQLPLLRLAVVFGEPPPSSTSLARADLVDWLDTPIADPPPLPTYTDGAAVVFTAGTTGPSKAVLMSHAYLITTTNTIFTLRAIGRDDVVFGPGFPLFHLSGIGNVVGSLLKGATSVLEPFSVSNFWRRVRELGATVCVSLGSSAIMLWNQPPSDDDRHHALRIIVAVPVPAEILRAFEKRFNVRVVAGYGQSECAPICADSHDNTSGPGLSGRANPLLDVRIFDDNDEELPIGSVGEVVVRPRHPNVMFSGYFNNPEATVAQWRNLWFHTGDLGMFTEDGWFRFVDRKKDYLRRRGENISSFEVETAILQHRGIAEVAVVGAKSDVGEDEVKACVVLAPGEPWDPVALLDFCVEHLPYFAVPRYLEVYEQFPKNQVGRVLKYELREHGIRASTLDREAIGYEVRRPSTSMATPAPVKESLG